MDTSSPDQYAVQRVRHPLKARLLVVNRVESISQNMVRVTLTGDLDDFISSSFDDHIKVFFPEGDAAPVLPTFGPNGPSFPEGTPRPTTRDYTPRRYRTNPAELDIDFVLHDHGPAGMWAAQAQPGQHLGIAGPRGSFVIPKAFDWHLLIGDETALPAIARRLEELPAGTRVIAIIEIRQPEDRISLTTSANATVQWVHATAENEVSPLVRATQAVALPDGEGFVWAAGESAAIKAVRQHLTQERGIDKSRIRAASYWRRGDTGSHEVLED
jgi:NADPH-dependent ferric siderophore reductase